ncbi:hypothetical protein GDO78_021931 [Eleutherodactylus coqui]|uniref:Uncharacterized protein n=1 Tax=Eleutherodactylus coqui TaxID=57060 RepID=A0A8J6BH94_ELECQ|nr:hypothetical protein GDO78_021931 [Eleutherodactylus coqui]
MYKDIGGQYKYLSHHLFIPRTARVTGGHSLRLEKRRRGFFTVRAVRLWNSLPEDVVIAKLMEFKRGLDAFLERYITGYRH